MFDIIINFIICIFYITLILTLKDKYYDKKIQTKTNNKINIEKLKKDSENNPEITIKYFWSLLKKGINSSSIRISSSFLLIESFILDIFSRHTGFYKKEEDDKETQKFLFQGLENIPYIQNNK